MGLLDDIDKWAKDKLPDSLTHQGGPLETVGGFVLDTGKKVDNVFTGNADREQAALDKNHTDMTTKADAIEKRDDALWADAQQNGLVHSWENKVQYLNRHEQEHAGGQADNHAARSTEEDTATFTGSDDEQQVSAVDSQEDSSSVEHQSGIGFG